MSETPGPDGRYLDGTTLDFAALTPRERTLAAALFEAGRNREVPYYPFIDGTYDETPDGMQWLANDASTCCVWWDREPTRASVVEAAARTSMAYEGPRPEDVCAPELIDIAFRVLSESAPAPAPGDETGEG